MNRRFKQIAMISQTVIQAFRLRNLMNLYNQRFGTLIHLMKGFAGFPPEAERSIARLKAQVR